MSKSKPWTRNQKLILLGLIIAGITAITPFALRFIPQQTSMDKEEIEKIAEKVFANYIEEHGEDFQGFQPDRDQLKTELTKALERTNSLAVKGNRPDAEKALKELRERGDFSSLQELLIKERDKHRDMLVLRNREIASVAYLNGDIDKAAAALDEILTILPDDMAALNRKGHIYLLRGELNRAEDCHQRVLKLARGLKDQRAQAVSLGNLGLVYRKRGDLDMAERTFREGLKIDQELGNLEGIAAKCGNLGLIYKDKGDLYKAEEVFTKSLEIDEKLGSQEGIASNYCNLGYILRKRGEPDRAEQMHKTSLEIATKSGLQRAIAANYDNLGFIYKDRNETERARECWEKALELYKKMGMIPDIKKVQEWIDELDKGSDS